MAGMGVEVEPPDVREHQSRDLAYRASQRIEGWHAGPWCGPMPHALCPKFRDNAPGPCDCGHEGTWEWRLLFGQFRSLMVWQERCPGCGDIESFDWEGNYSQQRADAFASDDEGDG